MFTKVAVGTMLFALVSPTFADTHEKLLGGLGNLESLTTLEDTGLNTLSSTGLLTLLDTQELDTKLDLLTADLGLLKVDAVKATLGTNLNELGFGLTDGLFAKALRLELELERDLHTLNTLETATFTTQMLLACC